MVHKSRQCRDERAERASADFKEALAGEGWAINDYTDLIAKVNTEHEKKVLTEIRDEEKQHQSELLGLAKCKVK
jgi:rubrerythrin